MSWDAELVNEITGTVIYGANYTHNCNHMANEIVHPPIGSDLTSMPLEELASWWVQLDAMDGPRSADLLDRIILGLEEDPERFRTMNPTNGWGSYDSFLATIKEMRSVIPHDRPCYWVVTG